MVVAGLPVQSYGLLVSGFKLQVHHSSDGKLLENFINRSAFLSC